MNIFGIGGPELVLIILIMLVVAGPKRMIRWAYVMGRYVAKLRKMWEEVVDVMQQEVDAAGFDIEIPKELPTRQNISKVVGKAIQPYTDQVEKELKEAQKELEAAQKPLQAAVDDANKVLKDTQKEASDAVNGTGTTTAEKSSDAQEHLEDKADKTISGFGAWSNTGADNTEAPVAEDTDISGFGAWSNPQHPGQQTEQKAK